MLLGLNKDNCLSVRYREICDQSCSSSHHELDFVKPTRHLGLVSPAGTNCKMEIIDPGLGTSRARRHKTWASSSMSFPNGHKRRVAFMMVEKGNPLNE